MEIFLEEIRADIKLKYRAAAIILNSILLIKTLSLVCASSLLMMADKKEATASR